MIDSDGEAHYDAEWLEAPRLPPEELYDLWYSTIARCRKEWTGLIADGGLDLPCTDDPDYVVNRRRRLVDILEENLLHTPARPPSSARRSTAWSATTRPDRRSSPPSNNLSYGFDRLYRLYDRVLAGCSADERDTAYDAAARRWFRVPPMDS